MENIPRFDDELIDAEDDEDLFGDMVDIVPADPKLNAPRGRDDGVGEQDSKGSSTNESLTSADGTASSAEQGDRE